VTSRAVTATLLIVLMLAVGCGDEAGQPSSRSSSGSAETPPSSDGGGLGRCDFPPFRPAQLPWLKAGQPPPPPSRERFEGYAQLAWSARDSSYLVLWRVNEPLGGPGDPAPSLPNGAVGYLYESSTDEDIAAWSIVWADPQEDGCNQTTLSLYSPSLTKQEGKRQIVRLAASLRSET
jgi:hypothetical protein